MRLDEPEQVDMVLGDGARDRPAARLGERRDVHASLDHGAKLLEQLPRPEHPRTTSGSTTLIKWIFYAATCYTWLGDDQAAEAYAGQRVSRWPVERSRATG